ncbi:ABC transporter permease [Plantibacter sp. VKM Ac-2876]|uniref:ABC transporter permease n=1 Tax=Plantibacter sp. VKM Ac-2876 TaxID=2783826 RepID=UPI00188D2C30|nr:ABC transporter permease [Plantibacter sp. VKM Ac-2876]MBF4564494.1 ABC transporter permease [Plantibacter sp. VKM Ac-2876]
MSTVHPFPAQVRSFAAAHAHDLVRDPRSIIALVASFLALIGLLWGVDALVATVSGTPAGVLERGLPLVSSTGSMAIAFMLTTVPLVRHRSTGLLRALSTSPARRDAYLLGHLPIRVGLVVVEAAVIIALAASTVPTRPLSDLVAIAGTILLGGAMLLGFGYLLAARLSNPDIAMQLAYLLPMLALATSGALFPLAVLPEWVAGLFRLLPTTWIVGALEATISHGPQPVPLAVVWSLMAACALVSGLAAARLHRWDVG